MLRLILVSLVILVGACYCLKGSFYVLLFYLWNAYFTPEAWVWNGELIVALRLSFVLGVTLLVTTPFSSAKFQFDRRVLLLMLFLAQSALSAVFTEHHDLIWEQFTQFFRIIVVSYLMIVLVTDSKRFGLVLLVIGLSLGLEGAKQGWVHMLLHPGAVNTNRISFLGDNNGVGVGMLMLAPLLLVAGQVRRTRSAQNAFRLGDYNGGVGMLILAPLLMVARPQNAFRFLAVGVIFRALTTYSRGALLTGGVLAATFLTRVRGRKIVSAAVGVVLIGTVVLAMLPEQYWNRMATVFTWSDESSAAGRPHFWKVALSMADENRLLGVGFSGYSLSYDEYDPSEGEYGTARACHSSWFGVLADLGVPGLLLFVALFVSAFKTCRRVLALTRANPENEALEEIGKYASALRYSLIAFIVGGTFVSMQYNEMVWHLLALSFALDTIARKAVEDHLDVQETTEQAVDDPSSGNDGVVSHAGGRA